MSSFWSLKIGGSKRGNKKPLRRDRTATSAVKDESTKEAPSEIVRSLMERALTDAEQLVESIKAKAQKEAEEEIAQIIEQASEGSTETASLTESVKQSEIQQAETTPAPTEEPLEQVETEAEPVAIDEPQEQAEVEAKSEPAAVEEAEILNPYAVETEEPVVKGETETGQAALEDITEEPAATEEESVASEPTEPAAEEIAEQPVTEEKTEDEEPSHAAIELDKDAMYAEDIEIAIAVPVDPVAVSKLYNSLQTTPEIKILYTRGSWDRGTVITVTLEKPLPLLDIISNIPGMEVTPIETPEKDTIKGAPSALLGGDKKETKRIDLKLKAK